MGPEGSLLVSLVGAVAAGLAGSTTVSQATNAKFLNNNTCLACGYISGAKPPCS